MKLLQYELGSWQIHKSKTCKFHNWYRSGVDEEGYPIHIGLIRKYADESPQTQIWRVDYALTPIKIHDILDLLNLNKIYLEEELEQAKKDVDNLIFKTNKLKCFL